MEVIATTTFIRSAKAIAKKYRSFNADYQKLVAELTQNPNMGSRFGRRLPQSENGKNVERQREVGRLQSHHSQYG